VLLRNALVESGKIAIAKVVIRARQHLAAVKPQKKGPMLELMHFPEELLDASEFKAPTEKAVGKAELQMAKQLIQGMTSAWKPEQYTDEYHHAVEKMIEEKIEHGGEEAPVPVKKKKPTNVVDLAAVLQQSLQRTQARPKSEKVANKTRATRRKKAA
jgi:DNA end-binding protein Ku